MLPEIFSLTCKVMTDRDPSSFVYIRTVIYYVFFIVKDITVCIYVILCMAKNYVSQMFSQNTDRCLIM